MSMQTPKDLMYSKSHEWILFIDEATARIGLTDFAQHSLGDLVFVNLPETGDLVTAGESFGDVESVKAVSDMFSPVSGEVAAINEAVLDAPQLINSNPYGTWLIEVKDIGDKEEFLDAAAYEKICVEEE